MESDQMLFRERVLSEIIELKAKVFELDTTIQAQNAEIEQLKSENECLRCMPISGNYSISCNDKLQLVLSTFLTKLFRTRI
jgi:hypothetical protein